MNQIKIKIHQKIHIFSHQATSLKSFKMNKKNEAIKADLIFPGVRN